ncbi:MAG: hypothetical protein E6K71_06270 [Candidatus Eisenbacteria bacterium]|uniref:Uncharacterized protein n=1 Tax=Eiseniibacteriota bacterium TaxID=2212470 RepID=A0A538SC28_UNCEI|nr:MAG: hypothetical protein E6K71_06270 [Candidatus Eisenbacteria bacterium]
MLKRLALLLGAALLLFFAPPPSRASADPEQTAGDRPMYVGPTEILFADADSVYYVVSREWLSASVRHQEKLLRRAVRMAYWLKHVSKDMRMVFDALGYPTGRVLATPAGHNEEWWYYGELAPPLRFRDGALIDTDEFEALLSR